MSLVVVAPFYLPLYPVPILIPSMLAQVDQNWTAIFIHDGPHPAWDMWTEFFNDPRIRFRSTEKRMQEFGHPLRAAALEEEDLDGRYVVMSNGDNYFMPTFAGAVNKCTSDVVAWSCAHSYYGHSCLTPKVEFAHIDLCQVAVRSDLAKEVGFKGRMHGSDFGYIEEVAERTHDITFLDGIYSVHN